MTPALLAEIKVVRAWLEAQVLPTPEVTFWVWVAGDLGVTGYGVTPLDARRMAAEIDIKTWLGDKNTGCSLFEFVTSEPGAAVQVCGSPQALMALCMEGYCDAWRLEFLEFMEGLLKQRAA
jgi:hypothetical protein